MIRYNNILREEYGFGDRMFGEDGSDKELDEMERFLFPGIVFVFFPVFFSLLGILTLTQLPWLIGQYNYLRGASSPIDQSTLALSTCWNGLRFFSILASFWWWKC